MEEMNHSKLLTTSLILKNLIEQYNSKVQEIIFLISKKQFREVNPFFDPYKNGRNFDKLVTDISLLLMEFYPKHEKCFYNTTLEISSKTITSEISSKFNSLCDHWVSSNDECIFVAWKHDSAYFETYWVDKGNVKRESHGFSDTLKKLKELSDPILNITSKIDVFHVQKVCDVHFLFQ
jgi:hypothetical protein